MLKVFFVTLAVLIALVIGWHLAFFLLGGIIAVTAATWGIIVASVVGFCAAILAIFVVTGIGIFVLGSLAAVWTIIAIILFPILFPILAPLFIILLFIAYFRRKQVIKTKGISK